MSLNIIVYCKCVERAILAGDPSPFAALTEIDEITRHASRGSANAVNWYRWARSICPHEPTGTLARADPHFFGWAMDIFITMEHEEDTAFPLLFTVLRPGRGKYWLTPAEAEGLKAELEFIGMVSKPHLDPDTLARLVDFCAAFCKWLTQRLKKATRSSAISRTSEESLYPTAMLPKERIRGTGSCTYGLSSPRWMKSHASLKGFSGLPVHCSIRMT